MAASATTDPSRIVEGLMRLAELGVGDRASLDIVRKRLSDADPNVKVVAAHVYATSTNDWSEAAPALVGAIENDTDAGLAAAMYLWSCQDVPSSDVRRLELAASRGTMRAASNALIAASRLGPTSPSVFLAALARNSDEFTARALLHGSARPELARALSSHAAELLATSDDSDVVDFAADVLRVAGVQPDSAARRRLAAMAYPDVQGARGLCAWAAEWPTIGDDERSAVSRLVDSDGASFWALRAAVKWARAGRIPVQCLVEMWRRADTAACEVASEDVESFVGHGEPAVTMRRLAGESPSSIVRSTASLGKLFSESVVGDVNVISELTQSAGVGLRRKCARLLRGRVRAEDANSQRLARILLLDADPGVRYGAIVALHPAAESLSRDALDAVSRVVRGSDDTPEARVLAADMLIRVGRGDEPTLRVLRRIRAEETAAGSRAHDVLRRVRSGAERRDTRE